MLNSTLPAYANEGGQLRTLPAQEFVKALRLTETDWSFLRRRRRRKKKKKADRYQAVYSNTTIRVCDTFVYRPLNHDN